MVKPFLMIFPDRIVLRVDPGFLPKGSSFFSLITRDRSSPSGSKEEVFHTLDVKRCLLLYLEVTKEFRKSFSLFVLFSGLRKGYHASKSTIRRWLRMAIKEGYTSSGQVPLDGIMAHSTRAVATSWAERAGTSPKQIRKAATRTSFSTFIRHYRIDLL